METIPLEQILEDNNYIEDVNITLYTPYYLGIQYRWNLNQFN